MKPLLRFRRQLNGTRRIDTSLGKNSTEHTLKAELKGRGMEQSECLLQGPRTALKGLRTSRGLLPASYRPDAAAGLGRGSKPTAAGHRPPSRGTPASMYTHVNERGEESLKHTPPGKDFRLAQTPTGTGFRNKRPIRSVRHVRGAKNRGLEPPVGI